MSATAPPPNGTPRRQLSDQLDRLDRQMDRADAILDALAEGLNGAVADATRDGTRQAVKEAVIELLTDPDLRATLHRASAPPRQVRPSPWERLRAAAHRAAARAKAAVGAAAAAVAARVGRAVAAGRRLAARARVARPVRVAARVLAAGLAVAALARGGAARRILGLVDRARAAAADAVMVARRWVRPTGARLPAA